MVRQLIRAVGRGKQHDALEAINPSLPPIEASKIDIYLQQEASPFCVAKVLQVRMERDPHRIRFLDKARPCVF